MATCFFSEMVSIQHRSINESINVEQNKLQLLRSRDLSQKHNNYVVILN